MNDEHHDGTCAAPEHQGREFWCHNCAPAHSFTSLDEWSHHMATVVGNNVSPKRRLPFGLTYAVLGSAIVAALMFLSGSATLALQLRAVLALEQIAKNCK